MIRVLMVDGFAMNPSFPVSALTARRVKIDWRSPSQPAMIPSSFSNDNARQPVVSI